MAEPSGKKKGYKLATGTYKVKSVTTSPTKRAFQAVRESINRIRKGISSRTKK